MPKGMDSEEGAANLSAALSGDVNLAGANQNQVEALGGEIDENDKFTADAIARGDMLPEDIPPQR